ncbi:MAG: OmpA family protein [Alphaproteobacteria bacterium]
MLAPETPARSEPEPVQLALALDGGGRAAAKPATPGDRALEIAFDAASRTLPAGSTAELNRIVAEVKARPDLTVRLYGGARGDEPHAARELALARAVAVHRYLVSRGVGSAAIKVEPVTGETSRDAVAVRLVSPA